MRRTALAFILVLSFAVAAYAAVTYGFGTGAARLHPEMRVTFESQSVAITLHIFASALALLLGPLQSSRRLRARRPGLHRWMGRIYLGVAVAVGGTAGLYMSYHAFGGAVARLGFASLAAAWLYTGVRAFTAARRHDFAAHRRWMIRNFSLAFAAVTLRLYMPPVFILQLPFESAYAVIAWISWLPNLAVAELIIAMTQRDAIDRTASGARRLPDAAAAAER